MPHMRIARAAAVLALTVIAPLAAGTTATAAPAPSTPTATATASATVQGNMGWQ
ncbi:hypothetical protein [Streptomyces sp. cmx-4-9]|uniref:hypothetical protein n=1 Tax=Streptomyces sp. cmx-4-9 TaxID=2790941 RepID=UPI00397FEBD8